MSDQLKDKVASHEAFSDIFYTVDLVLEDKSFIVCFSYDRSVDERNRVKVRDYHKKEDVSFDELFKMIPESKKESLFEKARETEKTL